MAVFMCMCVRLGVLAQRGNRGLGNLRHSDTALIIDSILSLWRHYRGFEPGPAFMKYILGRFWSGRKCWCMWEGGWGGARLFGRRRTVVHFPLGLAEKHILHWHYHKTRIFFLGKTNTYKKGHPIFIFWVVLSSLYEFRGYRWITFSLVWKSGINEKKALVFP